MTAPKGSIERLSRYREIKLSVTGRKSGKICAKVDLPALRAVAAVDLGGLA